MEENLDWMPEKELNIEADAKTCKGKDPDWILPKEELNIEANAETIIETCKGRVKDVPKFSLLNVSKTPPIPPSKPLTRSNLFPTTSRIHLEKGAFSSSIREFCLRQPIVLVTGIVTALNFNMDLFTTETIMDMNPNEKIELRMQKQPLKTEENWNETGSQQVWKCYSRQNYSTIDDYGHYQIEKLTEEKKKKEISNNGQSSLEEVDKTKEIRFGTNLDLSNEKKWKLQLDELKKLPPFFQVSESNDMLNYVDHKILGVNTVQLYMKIAGCRTPGHQENNNFCSVNINVGPGDCIWFAVPYEYWGALCSLCERSDVDYLQDSWWPPNVEVLLEANIPVYKFIQKSGTLVFVNVGCVHWVQSISVCNNIAWNIGPFTAHQYQAALERYEWNKLRRFQSIVPMVHLSWRLACKVKLSDERLYRMIKTCLLLTLRQYYLTLEFLETKGINIVSSEYDINNTPYCKVCKVEIFGILLSRCERKQFVLYCLDCALKQSPLLEGFVCIEEININDLIHTYDNFILESSN